MASFLTAILAFPTVVFTVLVGLFLLYAIATLVGALDIHWLDGVIGIDHAPDSVLEGALNFLGVAGIPLTIFGGVSSVFAWVTSIAATKFLPGSVAMSVAVLIGSAVAGLVLGGLAVRPMRGIFTTPVGASRKQIVGKICTVRSLRVSETSGTAEVNDGGAGFIAEIRCFRDNQLTLGSKAIVYDYDHKNDLFHVGPIDPSIVDADLVGRPTTTYTPRQRDLA
jgi:hypothetical protein